MTPEQFKLLIGVIIYFWVARRIIKWCIKDMDRKLTKK